MKSIGFGIIGTGLRGVENFGKGLLSRPKEAKLIALCDTNNLRLQSANRILGGNLELYDDYKELLNNKNIDAVIITTPDFTHEEIAVASFRKGKHVLCEKPLAINVEGCKRIIKASEKANKQLEVGFVLRYVKLFQEVKKIIEQGILGQIYLVEFGDYYAGGASYFRRWNRFSKISGGLLIHKGTHSFDILNWFLKSMPRQVAAFGGINVFISGKHKGKRCLTCQDRCRYYFDITKGVNRKLFYEAEKADGYIPDVCIYNSRKDTFDNSVVMIEYESGAKVSYTECFFCQRTTRHFLIIGEDGELEADETEGTIKISLQGRRKDRFYKLPQSDSGHGGGDEGQIAHFLKCLRSGKSALASGEAGLWSVAIGQAAEISTKENRIVKIKEFFKGTSSTLHRHFSKIGKKW